MNENTSTSTNQTAPKTFDIIDGNTLMEQTYNHLTEYSCPIRSSCVCPR